MGRGIERVLLPQSVQSQGLVQCMLPCKIFRSISRERGTVHARSCTASPAGFGQGACKQ